MPLFAIWLFVMDLYTKANDVSEKIFFNILTNQSVHLEYIE